MCRASFTLKVKKAMYWNLAPKKKSKKIPIQLTIRAGNWTSLVFSFSVVANQWWTMFIKSIVLDGFKSYAQRTEITGFDQMFNAITGLNGSGKSNILDSICFVLGISNLHHVSINTAKPRIPSSIQHCMYVPVIVCKWWHTLKSCDQS